MRIALEARAAEERTGVGTYVRELLRGLAQSGEDVHKLPDPSIQLLLPFWLQHTAPKYVASILPDIAHFTKADVPRKRTVPTVVTIYDVIPLLLPESQSPLRRIYWPRALHRAAEYSDHILTISEASRRGIVELLDVPGEKITVTPLAVDTEHFKPSHGPLERRQSPYVLFVGRWDIRKNIPSLIKAFARIASDIPHQLVIAGRPADKPVDLRRVAREAGVAERVIFRENVSFGELPHLYAGADLFVYPSIIEGWGFPPQEAMACGTPVIVSSGDPLPEVVGSAGAVVPFTGDVLANRLTDAKFIERLAAQMKKVLMNDDLRSRMSSLGLEHIQSFSWQYVVDQTLAVYKQVV